MNMQFEIESNKMFIWDIFQLLHRQRWKAFCINKNRFIDFEIHNHRDWQYEIMQAFHWYKNISVNIYIYYLGEHLHSEFSSAMAYICASLIACWIVTSLIAWCEYYNCSMKLCILYKLLLFKYVQYVLPLFPSFI